MIHMTANLMACVFWIEAGWPYKRSLRSRWTAFFSTSALSIIVIYHATGGLCHCEGNGDEAISKLGAVSTISKVR